MLEALFERTAEGLLVTDNQGNILLANPAFWVLFGCTPQKRINIGQFLITKQTGEQLVTDCAACECNGLKKDGTQFPVLLSLRKIIGQEGIYYAGYLHDLSQEKSSAKMLAREQELGRLKSRLVSMASHEFRSPLSQIQLSASLVERYYQRLDQDKILSHLQKIRMAVSDMTETLNDFLSLERIEAGTLQPELRSFDLVSFGEEACTQMRLIAGGRELQFQHSGKERLVISDRNLLKHCVVNLLSNAVKYSADTGRIILRTEIAPEGFLVAVTDQGIGIPQAEQQKLFEPFFRASNATEVSGTGLGLHIVRNYVQRLGGKIRVQSRENKGTTFSLSFPLLVAQTAAAAHPVA